MGLNPCRFLHSLTAFSASFEAEGDGRTHEKSINLALESAWVSQMKNFHFSS
jgi:hypothetical protein